MTHRIIGFDLARAYAIFGMFIVNFVNVFGGYTDKSITGKFASLFNGNASTLFVMLAGMGVSLLTSKRNLTEAATHKIKAVIIKRSWFLFALGLLLYNWWPFDILHFYGAYMHIAALLLFINKRWYLWGAILSIIIFHVLLFYIPYETGWNFSTFSYTDFWTAKGFIRNSLYNGSNPVFPWLSLFLLGMWLGKLNWNDKTIKRKLFLVSLPIFIAIEILQLVASKNIFSKDITAYILADYFPPFLPFLLSTASAGILALLFFCFVAGKTNGSKAISLFANMGRMTLTFYLLHLTAGMLLLSAVLNKPYSANLVNQKPTAAIYTILFSVAFYCIGLLFSFFWMKKFKNGPVEMLMRKVCG